MPGKLSKAARAALAAVTGKRARIVVEHILKHGSITTDDLKEKYGYDHPPRAIKDVSDQGIPLVKIIVKKKDGKRMAEYRFGDLDNITAGRVGGRANFPKAFKEALVAEYGSRCCLCNAPFEPRALQIDHRIPYLVAGDGVSPTLDVKDYMLVCGSCNRAKSKCCCRKAHTDLGNGPVVSSRSCASDCGNVTLGGISAAGCCVHAEARSLAPPSNVAGHTGAAEYFSPSSITAHNLRQRPPPAPFQLA